MERILARNAKIQDAQVSSLIRSWLKGVSANKAAGSANVSVRTAQSYYRNIRQRIFDEDQLTGWMGGGARDIPGTHHDIWNDLYDCLMDCHSGRTSPGVPNCLSCPLGLEHEFPRDFRRSVREHSKRVGGIPKRNFKSHFFEICYRYNITQSGEDEAHKEIRYKDIVKVLRTDPL